MSGDVLQTLAQLHRVGRLDEAELGYRQILARQPNHADTVNALGVLLLQKGQVGIAIELLRRAAALSPGTASYHRNLGLAYKQTNQHVAAIEAFQKVAALEPMDPTTYERLCVLLARLGQYPQAIEAGEKAVRLRPDVAEFRGSLAAAYLRGGKANLAVAELQQATRLAPGDLRFWLDLGAALAEAGRHIESLESFDKCVALNPSLAVLHSNRSAVLRELGRHEEAWEAIRKAAEIDPNFQGVQNNLGNMYFEDGDLEGARIAWGNAVKHDPRYAGAHWNYARVLLALGHFEEGWEEFEWRFWIPGLNVNRQFKQPQWDGSDPGGKTVLLYTEGGFGDALNFIRLAPLVTGRNAKWILECQPELIRLFSSLPGVPEMIPRGGELPHFDLRIPLQGLPRILKIREETIPNKVPYLFPPEYAVKRWAERLADEKRVKVGLAWAGSSGVAGDSRTRSIEVYAPLAGIEGVKFFSLQKGAEAGQIPPAGMELADYTGEFSDFAESAAFVQNLDLVISVDTSTAHLAGALGKPVWIQIPWTADFRWMYKRKDSPWYPTMRLFQDPKRGDNRTPFLEIGKALREFVGSKASA
jgi:tetratricopeptide (TPR) repeat protein